MADIIKLASELVSTGWEAGALKVKAFQESTVSAAAQIDAAGARMGTTGKKVQQKLGLPLAAVGGLALKMALDFDDSFTKIAGLVGVPAGQLEIMRERVLGLAGETARAPAELANALFTVTSAGFRGAEALEVLEAAAKASAIGMGDTRTIAEALTATISAYGPGVISAAEATDILTATVRAGNFESSQLAGSLGQILPVASELDIAFSDIGGSVALLTRSNNNATQSITQVRGIMTALIKPSSQANEILKAQGLTMADIRATAAGPGGLVAAIQQLSDAAGGNQEKLAAMLGRAEALGGALTILGADAATLEETFGAVADSTGVLNEAFSVTADSDAFKAKQAFAELQAAGIELGQALIPVGLEIISMAQGMATAFSGLPEGVQAIAAYAIVAGVALGPTLRLAGGITSLTASMIASKSAGTGLTGTIKGLNPATVGAAAAAAAAITIYTLWATEQARAAAAAKELADALSEQGTVFDEMTQAAYRGRLEAADAVGTFDTLGLSMDGLTDQVASGTDEFERMGSIILGAPRDLERLKASAEGAGQGFGTYATAIFDAVAAGELERAEAAVLLSVLDDLADSADEGVSVQKNNTRARLEAVDAAGLLTEETRALITAQINEATTAADLLEIKQDLIDVEEGLTESSAVLGAQTGVLAGTQGFLTDEIAGTLTALEELDALEKDRINRILESIDANLRYENQQARTTAEIRDYMEAAGSSKTTVEDLDQAQRDAAGAALAQADAAVALAEAQAEADGATLSNEESLRTQIAALTDVADQLAPGNPLRTQLLGYIADLEGVPLDLITDARLNGDAESIRLYEAMLDRITADRFQRINISYTGGGQRPVAGQGAVEADGHVVMMANGGVTLGDRGVARIGQSGESILFAEAGDGPESYIPWADSRRARSTDILNVTADAFGYDLMPKGQIDQLMAVAASAGGGRAGNTYNLKTVDNGAIDLKRSFAKMEKRDLVAAFQ